MCDLQGTKFYTMWDESDLQIPPTCRHIHSGPIPRAKLQPIRRAHDKKSKMEVTEVTRVEHTRWGSPRGHEVYEYEGKKSVTCHVDVVARDLTSLNLT